MDVRVGLPNEHLGGPGKNEINQPMYATSVGLIIKGFEFLDTYHKKFIAGKQDEFVRPAAAVKDEAAESVAAGTEEVTDTEEKVSLTEKIKTLLTRMFEVEDQKFN